MRYLHIFTEEPSIKIVFETILPKILPENVFFQVYAHQGKKDLEQALRKTLPTISRMPNSKVLITRDQDSADCKEVKQQIVELTELNCSCEYKVRVVCRELEAWFLGDMSAIENAYPRFKAENFVNKAEYRNVDSIASPNKVLLRMIPEYQGRSNLPKIETAENIASYLDFSKNNSESFNNTLDAIQQLIS